MEKEEGDLQDRQVMTWRRIDEINLLCIIYRGSTAYRSLDPTGGSIARMDGIVAFLKTRMDGAETIVAGRLFQMRMDLG